MGSEAQTDVSTGQCANGHLFTDANTYWRPSRNTPICKECRRESSRAYQRRKREKQRNEAWAPGRPPEYVTDSEVYREVALTRLRAGYVEDPDTGCWVWTRSVDPDGYGKFTYLGKSLMTHRAAYCLLVGEIPAGMELDHLCRVRRCINPAHLEPVTARENVLRSEGLAAVNAAKTHCIRGHEFTPDNLLPSAVKAGYRACWQCLRLRSALRDTA